MYAPTPAKVQNPVTLQLRQSSGTAPRGPIFRSSSRSDLPLCQLVTQSEVVKSLGVERYLYVTFNFYFALDFEFDFRRTPHHIDVRLTNLRLKLAIFQVHLSSLY